MDARPQRSRVLLPRSDENSAIIDNNDKYLHHRHKSTGNLLAMSHPSTNAAAGTLKAHPKRSAFSDLTNAVRLTKDISIDDSILNGKSGKENLVHVPAKGGKASAPLQKPAQKPSSSNTLKDLLNMTTTVTALAPRQALGNASSASQNNTIQPKKTVVKRTTTVFKDEPAPEIKSKQPSTREQPASSIIPQLPATKSTAPRHYKSQPSLKQQGPSLRKTKSRVLSKPDETVPAIDPLTLKLDISVSRPSGSLSDVPESDSESPAMPTQNEKALVHVESAFIPEPIQPQNPSVQCAPAKYISQPHVGRDFVTVEKRSVDAETSYHNSIQPAVEPEVEEYWDEDVEGEEEGYVTAQSYRSLDNSTGFTNTLEFVPQVTMQARKELAAAKHYIESTRTPEEIEDERFDTTLVMEYGDDIFAYMRELEIKLQPDRYYMDKQTELQWSMRGVLMDWVIQVHVRLGLLPETLFLTVNYIDRFLTNKVVSLGKLQLVGATAIFIAAKYEEINCPNVADIHFMVDGSYSKSELIKAERFMLGILDHQLGWPGPMSFLRRISKADDYDLETRTLAKYFLEVAVMEENFVASPPSFLAAASHCLARLMLRKGFWSHAHVYYSGYTFAQLRNTMITLIEGCKQPYQHHCAVYEKYSDRKYKQASIFVDMELQRGFRLPNVIYQPEPVDGIWYNYATMHSSRHNSY